MLLVRSLLFNVLFYANFAVLAVAAMFTLLMPRPALFVIARLWAQTNRWLLRVICGIDVQFRGVEKIPPGPLIVAAKHQSTWETFAILPLFSDPTFIIKRELRWIPVFGWFCWKADLIPVDRGARSQALVKMNAAAREQLKDGRQIIIFPEGTRRPPGAKPAYKYGVVHLYAEAGVPCLPIALNSGLFWPRRSLWRYPGTILVEVLDPIMPGLSKEAFAERLQAVIEEATARLIAEAGSAAVRASA